MSPALYPSALIERWSSSPFAALSGPAWMITQVADGIIAQALCDLGGEYVITGSVATHATAIVEQGAVLKDHVILGPDVFVASGAYLRGGVFLDEGCIVGPGSELKSSFMFKGSKLAHLNFVGDSILGSRVNVEAGAVVANYRNELDDKRIRIHVSDMIIDTGVDKFGVLAGDDVRIGANPVIAPGAILMPGIKVPRLTIVDQCPYV